MSKWYHYIFENNTSTRTEFSGSANIADILNYHKVLGPEGMRGQIYNYGANNYAIYLSAVDGAGEDPFPNPWHVETSMPPNGVPAGDSVFIGVIRGTSPTPIWCVRDDVH
jgi:hypothetical protein